MVRNFEKHRDKEFSAHVCVNHPRKTKLNAPSMNSLPKVKHYPTLRDQEARTLQARFQGAVQTSTPGDGHQAGPQDAQFQTGCCNVHVREVLSAMM